MLKFGGSAYARTSAEGLITTWTTYYGNVVGLVLGYDVYVDGPFHLSLNASYHKHDFSSVTVTQGTVSTTTTLDDHLTGSSYAGYLGI